MNACMLQSLLHYLYTLSSAAQRRGLLCRNLETRTTGVNPPSQVRNRAYPEHTKRLNLRVAEMSLWTVVLVSKWKMSLYHEVYEDIAA
jgi:hypothetical protein